jgi:hypothetical protein
MNRESNHRTFNTPQAAMRSDGLADGQREFARVVGQALAALWRRRWYQRAERPTVGPSAGKGPHGTK